MNTQIKITFLGTGTSSGVPMIGCICEVCTSSNEKDKRLRSSILVQSATTTVVIDTTPDFRYQMLRTNTKQVDSIVFTHPHKDHIGGLDDIKAYNFFSQKAMPLYLNEITLHGVMKEMHYAFAEDKYPGIPSFDIHLIDEEKFVIGDIVFEPIKIWHLKMPVLGFRIGDFTYITDANKIDETELQKIIGSKTLVLNALRKKSHISHFTLQEAVDLSNAIQIPKVYFTHISHQMGLHKDVNADLPNHIQLAFDGLVLDL